MSFQATSENASGFTPAFPAVFEGQKELKDSLRKGFDSWSALLLWQHDVTVSTLGYVDAEWHRRLATDRYQVTALTSGEVNDRGQVASEIIQETLTPAFRSAQGFLRQAAMDFDESLDTTKGYPGLRPRVGQLSKAQRDALEAIIDVPDGEAKSSQPSIENRKDIEDWVDLVVYATAGGVSESFTRAAVSPASEWWRAIFGDSTAAVHWIVADRLLPPMTEAIHNAAQVADEMPDVKDIEGGDGGGSIS